MSRDHADYVEAWTKIIFFLLHMEQDDPRAMWGGYNLKDVIDAVAFLHGAPPEALRRLIQ